MSKLKLEFYFCPHQAYLERDVRRIVNFGDLNTFRRFLRICAGRTAQIINMTEISRDVGVSVPTVKKWISILEASYQIYLLSDHARGLDWQKLTGDMAEPGAIIANIEKPAVLKNCRAIPWNCPLDL